MATAIAAKLENPNGSSVPKEMFPTNKMQPSASSHDRSEESKGGSAPPAEIAIIVGNEAAVAAQKKMELLSEKKRNTGAERLGIKQFGAFDEAAKEEAKIDTHSFGFKLYTHFSEWRKELELLRDVFIALILAKMIMAFFGKGHYLTIKLILEDLACVLLVICVKKLLKKIVCAIV